MSGTLRFAISDTLVLLYFGYPDECFHDAFHLTTDDVTRWFEISTREVKRHVATLVDDFLLFYRGDINPQLDYRLAERLVRRPVVNLPPSQSKAELPHPTSFARSITHLKAALGLGEFPVGHKVALSFNVPFMEYLDSDNHTTWTADDWAALSHRHERQRSIASRMQTHVLTKLGHAVASAPTLFPYIKHEFYRGELPLEHRDAKPCIGGTVSMTGTHEYMQRLYDATHKVFVGPDSRPGI